MSATEERVVRMRFDNAQFKQAAADTQTQLSGIDKAVSSAGKGKGLLDMASHMETVRVKASAMQVAAVTAISNIASKAVNAGLQMAKSLTLDPIKAGFDEYELKMKSIQTILSNTKGENLKSVTGYLNELNEYSDKTIYNFANMTTAIGKMTTAGIGLDDATKVVKGFHNMVALAGGDATQAAGAMEQFVYGLQAGKITALDWQSIATRGLGSSHLQRAFFETARAAGTLGDIPVGQTFEEWSKSVGGFKGSLESGWLTSDVAVKALGAMTGDVKNVQEMMALGFDKKTAEDMLDIAASATESATKVRTLTAFMGTLKEQIGSGWSQVMETIFGDFDEATNLFTKLSDITGKAVGGFFDYINGMLKSWDKMKGRLNLINAFKHIISPIAAILGAIAKAWGAAFPKKEGGSALASLSKGLEHLTRPLNVLGKLIRGELSPIEALIRLFQIAYNGVRKFINVITGMLGINLPSDNGFIKFFTDLSDKVLAASKQIQKLLKQGKGFKEALGSIDISMPSLPGMPKIPKLPGLPDIGGMMGGGESNVSGLTSGITGLSGSLASLKEADTSLTKGMIFNPDADISAGRVKDLGTLDDQMARTQAQAETLGDKASPILETLKDNFAAFMKGFNFEDLMASFNLAVLATFMISISRFMNTMSQSFQGFVGTGEALNGILDQAGNALKSFQTQAQAKLIINIAIAIGILAVSLWLLSRIPEDKLMTALIALGGVAAIIKVTLESFSNTVEKLDGKGLNVKMLALGASMILLAIAVSILASAMLKLNKVKWESVLKAGIAIYALVKAMERLSEMKKEDLLKSAFALMVVSGALIVFAMAIQKFASLDLKVFAEGLVYAALSLQVLTNTLDGFESSLTGALAMAVVVGALWLLVGVIEKFAKLDFKVFAEGLAYVAASLIVLVAAMYGFQSSLAGAVALVVAVGALYLLVGVIEAFAKLDWETFGKGLLMMTIGFVTLGALMALMGVFSPLILAGAAALLIFGAAMFLLGAGIMFLAKGMGALILISGGVVAAITAFATGAAIGFGVFLTSLALQAPIMKKSVLTILQSFIDTIVGAVPMIIDGVKRLWDAVMKELGGGKGGGPKQALMGEASKGWMEKLKDGILEKLPALVKAGSEILVKFLKALRSKAGDITEAGVALVASIIQGIGNKIGDIVAAAINLYMKFAEGIKNGLTTIVNTGIDLISAFLHDLATAIRNGSKAIGGGLKDVADAMKDVGIDIVKGMIQGVTSMIGDAMGAIGDLASGMVDKAKGILDIFSPSKVFQEIGKFVAQGMTKGIQDNAAAAIVATGSLVSGQIAVASEYISRFVQDLDQQAIKAGAKAAGVAKEAELAAKAAERAHQRAEKAEKAAAKTKKNKKDDKAARGLGRKADKLDDRAEAVSRKAERFDAKALRAEERAEEARQKAARAEEFEGASLIEKAEMRSEDAQGQMDAAKDAERLAAAKLAQAAALREEAKAKGVSKKDAKAMEKEADRLEKQARAQAAEANVQIELARQSAGDAMELQKQAGDEAAALFQARFEAEAKEDADAEAFEKLSDTEKAAERRRQADALQAKANADLQKAKELAYTDLEAANELADQAMDQAEQAREYRQEAEDFEKAAAQGTGISAAETGGTVVNLDPTAAASIAFNKYASRYDAGVAAAAGTRTVEFNQYNTSPEALSPAEVYRRTNNLLDHAIEKVTPSAA